MTDSPFERAKAGASASRRKADAPDPAADGESSWRNLLALDEQIFAQRNIRILTPEARVLIHLKLSGTLSVTTAMQLAGVSYRGFYAVLERLKQAGLVSQARDDDDQRVRNLSLDPSVPLASNSL
ncbi:MarR family winged helix-turn-helix transcriptional regulator [Novosphingobium album (ex Liu et al. 2023)]|uniref:MarR family winged helix-turn-helix transcriptional regulator n=1 Tax=Novosphingobium album (ex Liu et al. 2023) TaxID=3031130 RepID=A0ABT5WRC9_9SPHN|nr:MarR family winged helix-turn-helix transcriptional regulator [Novosphingobium album (ex Liu et al. 2023)]MDE8651822.1 MarR family winged helix-turn-helix transcriptional regulator [Novosphingobium album (ex Liu et al. 2023)]